MYKLYYILLFSCLLINAVITKKEIDDESSGDNGSGSGGLRCGKSWKCTPDGDFDEVQCRKSYCWCVDTETGEEIEATKKKELRKYMSCGDDFSGMPPSIPTIKTSSQSTTPDSRRNEFEVETEDEPDNGPEIFSNNNNNKHTNSIMRSSLIAKPGMLAGLICGAVVGLLCAVLLVMFIVYRMRKKDEGSYALDESKRGLTSNAAYTKATKDKEYFA